MYSYFYLFIFFLQAWKMRSVLMLPSTCLASEKKWIQAKPCNSRLSPTKMDMNDLTVVLWDLPMEMDIFINALDLNRW